MDKLPLDKLPLVDVTARIHDQQGRPCAGAVVRMRLCSPDKYQGLVVPREVSGTTDADGCCVLRVFPNALGYEGSVYDVHISFPASGAGGLRRSGRAGPAADHPSESLCAQCGLQPHGHPRSDAA